MESLDGPVSCVGAFRIIQIFFIIPVVNPDAVGNVTTAARDNHPAVYGAPSETSKFVHGSLSERGGGHGLITHSTIERPTSRMHDPSLLTTRALSLSMANEWWPKRYLQLVSHERCFTILSCLSMWLDIVRNDCSTCNQCRRFAA